MAEIEIRSWKDVCRSVFKTVLPSFMHILVLLRFSLNFVLYGIL
jgi:hypothetical protein